MIYTTNKCPPQAFIVKTGMFEQVYECGEDSEGLAATLLKQIEVECLADYEYTDEEKDDNHPDIPNFVWTDKTVFCLDVDIEDMSTEEALQFTESILAFVSQRGYVKPIATLIGHSYSPKFLFTPVTGFDTKAPQPFDTEPVEILSAEEAASLVGLQIAAAFKGVKCVEIHQQFFRPRRFSDHTDGGKQKWSAFVTSKNGHPIVRYAPDTYGLVKVDPLQISGIQKRLFGESAKTGDRLDHEKCPQHDPNEKFSASSRPLYLGEHGVFCSQCEQSGRDHFFSYGSLDNSGEQLRLVKADQSWWSILWHACRNFVWWNQIRYYIPVALGFEGTDVLLAPQLIREKNQQLACLALTKSISDRFWWKDARLTWHPGVETFGVNADSLLFKMIEGFGCKESELGANRPKCFKSYYKATNAAGEPDGWKATKGDGSKELDQVSGWQNSAFNNALSKGFVAYPDNHNSRMKGCMGIYGVRELHFCPTLPRAVGPVKFAVGGTFNSRTLPSQTPDEDALTVWDDIAAEFPQYDARLLKAILVGRAYFDATGWVGLIACVAEQGTGKTGQRNTASRVFGDYKPRELTAASFFKDIGSEKSAVQDEFSKARPFRFLDEAQSLKIVDASALNSMIGRDPHLKLNMKWGAIIEAPIGGPVVIAGAKHIPLYDQASFASRAVMIRLPSPLGDLREEKHSAYTARLGKVFGESDSAPRGIPIGKSKEATLDRLYTWACLVARDIAGREDRPSWQSLAPLFGGERCQEEESELEITFKNFISRCCKVKDFNSLKKNGILDMSPAGKTGSLRICLFMEMADLDNGSGEVWQKVAKSINKWLIPPKSMKFVIGIKTPGSPYGSHSFGLALVNEKQALRGSYNLSNIRSADKKLTGLRALSQAVNFEEIKAIGGKEEEADDAAF